MDEAKTSSDQVLVDPETDPAHSTNFCLSLFYYCSLRIGWIFKTESIVMPAVLDVIGGNALIAGFLPMLNRLGQSVPPFLASDLVRGAGRKKWIVVGSSLTMGGCFMALSLMWHLTGGQADLVFAGTVFGDLRDFLCGHRDQSAGRQYVDRQTDSRAPSRTVVAAGNGDRSGVRSVGGFFDVVSLVASRRRER